MVVDPFSSIREDGTDYMDRQDLVKFFRKLSGLDDFPSRLKEGNSTFLFN